MDMSGVVLRLGRVCCVVMLWHLWIIKEAIIEIFSVAMIKDMLVESLWIYLISEGLILIKGRIKYIFKNIFK